LELVDFGVGRLEIAFALTHFFGNTSDHFYDKRGLEIIVLEERTVLEAVNFAIFTQDAGIGRGIVASLHCSNHLVGVSSIIDWSIVVFVAGKHLIDVTR
jgi:hypothetical protein